MPRIIEAKVGKVVGPLRMKVASSNRRSSNNNTKTTPPPTTNHNDSVAFSPYFDAKRGRNSRIGMKKLRSKSVPSSTSSKKEASLLLGKPPETDSFEYDADENTIPIAVPKTKAPIYRSQELRVPTSTPNRNVEVSKESPNDFTTLADEQYYPTGSSISASTATGASSVQVQRFAMALDTRFLTTTSSSSSSTRSCAVVDHMIQNYKSFMKSINHRGITPCIVASTTSTSGGRMTYRHSSLGNKRVAAALSDLGIGITTHKLLQHNNNDDILRKVMDREDSTFYSQVDIQTSSTSNDGACSIPLPLNAAYSWLLFSAMVDSIVAEDATFNGFISSKTLKASKGPIHVSIICSDVSLFCDTHIESHRTNLQSFIDHVTPYFHQGLLNSIAITVATNSGHIEFNTKEHDENEIPMQASDQLHNEPTTEQQENHQTAMHKCVRMIELMLHDFSNGMHPCSGNDLTGTSFRCSFNAMKNTLIDFMALSHSLVRTALVGCNARLDCRLRRIELPVSGDGTHCSISLEASYEVFPFSACSFQAKFLSSDMDDLATMDLKVVQIIPLAMIDASLLFGIPLVVRAGLEQDYEQFQEMKILVRSFFTVLQKQEQAILLRAFSSREASQRMNSGYSCSPEQYYVLMAQEVPSIVLNIAHSLPGPNSGLLFRIAHVDHLLHDKHTNDTVFDQNILTDDDRETEILYTECIENSLATLTIGTYNPFTISIPSNGQSETLEVVKKCVEGDERTENSMLQEIETPPPPMIQNPMSSVQDVTYDSNLFSEMNISYEDTNVSIYDLDTNNDDMSDDAM